MNKRLSLLLIIIMLSGCVSIDTQNLTLTPIPTTFITFTPSPIPTISPSPTISPTPTFPPYIHEPFSIIFYRDRDLWIAEIGEQTIERRLTFEMPEMGVVNYAVSPDGSKIVYIPYLVDTLNSLIKIVDISTGKIEVVLGENDPYNEIKVFWIDNEKIAYVNQGLVPAFITEKTEEITTYIIYDLVSKQEVSTTEHKSISQSPNGRYWLTCSGFIVCNYTVHDLLTGRQSDIESNIDFGWFINWSPDSKLMLFTMRDSESDDCTNQLLVIDTETLQEKFITPEDKNVWDASVSPNGDMLVYNQGEITDFNICRAGSHNYWLMDTANNKLKSIPIGFNNQSTWGVQWTPDGKRLVFFYDNYGGGEGETLWSMNLDGTDLEPLLSNVTNYNYFKIISINP